MILIYTIYAATLFLILYQFIYFYKEKKKCQKYPFYSFRDKVVMEIIEKETPSKELMELYHNSNFIIEKLKHINFQFYHEALTRTFKDILEYAHKHDFKKFPEPILDNKPILDLKIQFGRILLQTAKQNSFVLRIVMTKAGFLLLTLITTFKFIRRIARDNPNALSKTKKNLKVAREVSYMNHVIAI